MNRNKERGVSIVNVILIILIFIACGVIYFLMTSEGIPDVAMINNSIGNYISEENDNVNTQASNATLSNDIIYGTSRSTEANVLEDDNQYKYYFYRQLDASGKGMYTEIINNTDSLKNGYRKISIASSSENVSDYFQACWDAFTMDNPEIFYVDTKKVSIVTQSKSTLIGGTTYEISLQPQGSGNYFLSCWSTEEQVQSAINQVEGITNSILAGASNYTSMYDKVKYIHDYIIENAEYDKTGDINNADIYGILIKHRAVCEGYARTFKYLLDKLNIPCVMVCGNGYSDDGSSEFHAWNYVLMDDNNWYAVDTTWDDPIVVGNGKLSDQTKHRYFLVGSSNFSKTHVEDGDVSGTGQNFAYPQLNTTDYQK